jgi:hypothetical protein
MPRIPFPDLHKIKTHQAKYAYDNTDGGKFQIRDVNCGHIEHEYSE